MLICVLSVFCRGRGTVDALLCPVVGKVLAAIGKVVAGAKGLKEEREKVKKFVRYNKKAFQQSIERQKLS